MPLSATVLKSVESILAGTSAHIKGALALFALFNETNVPFSGLQFAGRWCYKDIYIYI